MDADKLLEALDAIKQYANSFDQGSIPRRIRGELVARAYADGIDELIRQLKDLRYPDNGNTDNTYGG